MSERMRAALEPFAALAKEIEQTARSIGKEPSGFATSVGWENLDRARAALASPPADQVGEVDARLDAAIKLREAAYQVAADRERMMRAERTRAEAAEARAAALAEGLRDARPYIADKRDGAAWYTKNSEFREQLANASFQLEKHSALLDRIDAILAPDIHVTSEQSAALRGALLRSAEIVDDGDAAPARDAEERA